MRTEILPSRRPRRPGGARGGLSAVWHALVSRRGQLALPNTATDQTPTTAREAQLTGHDELPGNLARSTGAKRCGAANVPRTATAGLRTGRWLPTRVVRGRPQAASPWRWARACAESSACRLVESMNSTRRRSITIRAKPASIRSSSSLWSCPTVAMSSSANGLAAALGQCGRVEPAIDQVAGHVAEPAVVAAGLGAKPNERCLHIDLS